MMLQCNAAFKESPCLDKQWYNLSPAGKWGWCIPTVSHLNAVECRHNVVQFITILHTALRWQQENVNQTSNSQQTPHTSPSWASYGVSIMRKLKKIDRVITAPHCVQMSSIQYMNSHYKKDSYRLLPVLLFVVEIYIPGMSIFILREPWFTSACWSFAKYVRQRLE